MRLYNYFFLLIFYSLLLWCYYNQPTGIEKAIIGEVTPATTLLKDLPKPKEQIVVGLYKFRDRQYKASENGSTFYTAARCYFYFN
jgi:curli production assembly/transport component CsgG